jgi:hypothetical protein
LAAVLAVVVPSGANAAPVARADQVPAEANGLGQLTGLLPANHLTEESAIQVNLSNETVRLPLYPGIAYKGTPHQIAGSDVVYNAPIVATGNGPFDVTHHANTADRALAIHIAGPSKPGQFAESWADLLFVKGFDAGQPIVYLSTDAGRPLTAVLERSVYVPALNDASFNGGDDFLGSARERLFGFINGQTGASNPQAQGFQHLAKDGMVAKDASLSDTAFINALRDGGDLLNVFGDFPTLTDPRHSQAYSPLWDAQLGLWTPKAVAAGLNKRQIDEVQVFNLAATRPDLLTGVNPATGQPEPYGCRGRHQLRGHRLHQQGTDRQPRLTRPQLPVPHAVGQGWPEWAGPARVRPLLPPPEARAARPAPSCCGRGGSQPRAPTASDERPGKIQSWAPDSRVMIRLGPANSKETAHGHCRTARYIAGQAGKGR